MGKTYNYIDLFAGAGGLSLGLMNAGWQGLFAIEKNEDAFLTLKHNLLDNKNHFEWPSWLPKKNYDIDYVIKKYKTELEELEGKVSLVVGGPPCQGFSTAGARNEKDKRNKLVHAYIAFKVLHSNSRKKIKKGKPILMKLLKDCEPLTMNLIMIL